MAAERRLCLQAASTTADEMCGLFTSAILANLRLASWLQHGKDSDGPSNRIFLP